MADWDSMYVLGLGTMEHTHCQADADDAYKELRSISFF